jgi:putative oxidoreductase
MTTINIGEMISLPIPLGINALFIAGVIEFFGGLLIMLGLWTRLAAFFAALLMLMAYLTAHLAWFPTLNRGELAAMYFLAYLIILTVGPGSYSVDSWREIRRQEKRQEILDAQISRNQ